MLTGFTDRNGVIEAYSNGKRAINTIPEQDATMAPLVTHLVFFSYPMLNGFTDRNGVIEAYSNGKRAINTIPEQDATMAPSVSISLLFMIVAKLPV